MSHHRLRASLITAALLALGVTSSPATASILPTATGNAPQGVDTNLGLPTNARTDWANPAGDVNGDGFDDVVLRPNARDLRVSFGSASRENRVAATAPGWTITHPWSHSSDDYTAARLLGDVNGDGRDDLFVGLSTNGGYVNDGTPSGAIALGPAGPTTTNLPSATGSIGLTNSGDPGRRFTELSAAGDVDNDGYGDVVAIVDATRLSIIFGGSSTAGQVIDVAQPGARGFIVTAPTASSKGFTDYYAGSQPIGLGDVNGDGFDDVGLKYVESNGTTYAYVVLGRADRTTNVSLTTAGRPGRAWRLGPLTPYRSPSEAGGEITPIGNFDGDGLADFAVGLSSTQTGIVHGRKSTTDLAASAVTQRVDWRMYGFGWPLGGTDINGDGLHDLIGSAIRGSNEDDPTKWISTLIVFGKPSTSSISIPNLTGGSTTAGIRFQSGGDPLGDVDGDGAGDFGPRYGIVYGYTAGTVPGPGDDQKPIVSVKLNWGYQIGTCGLWRQRWIYRANADIEVNEPAKITFTSTQAGQSTRTATVDAPYSLRNFSLPASLTSGAIGTLTLTTVATDTAGQPSDPVVTQVPVEKTGHSGYLWGLGCPA